MRLAAGGGSCLWLLHHRQSAHVSTNKSAGASKVITVSPREGYHVVVLKVPQDGRGGDHNGTPPLPGKHGCRDVHSGSGSMSQPCLRHDAWLRLRRRRRRWLWLGHIHDHDHDTSSNHGAWVRTRGGTTKATPTDTWAVLWPRLRPHPSHRCGCSCGRGHDCGGGGGRFG